MSVAPHAPWDYEPTGPYRYMLNVDRTDQMVGVGENLPKALGELAAHLPPGPGSLAGVFDANNHIVFAWYHQPNGQVRYLGCKYVYDFLQPLVDPILLALMEADASGSLSDLGFER